MIDITQTPTGVPGGAAGVDYLRGQMAALATDAERHVFAIRNFETNVGFGVDVDMSRFCIEACRDFIARGVPCIRGDDQLYAVNQLVQNLWPAAIKHDVAELMQAYLDAGYLPRDFEGYVDHGVAGDQQGPYCAGHIYLEMAIRRSNVGAALALVSAGEQLDARPSRYPGSQDFESLRDLAQSTWQWSEADESLAQMDAAMHAASMRKQIEVSMAVLPAAAPAAGHNRRAGL